MRVLYINHPESDYGGAFLHNGLCQLVGDENVFDLPYKKSYHGEVHEYDSPWYGSESHGVTGPLPWMEAHVNAWRMFLATGDPDSAAFVRTKAESLIVEGFFDLVIVESLRVLALQTFRELKQKIQAANLKVVVHDGEDFEKLRDEELNEVSPTLILKREYAKHWQTDMQAAGAPILPFPFSFPYPYEVVRAKKREEPTPSQKIRALTRIKKRDQQLTFMCGNTWGTRQQVADMLRQSDIDAHVAIQPDNSPALVSNQLVGWFEYLEKMTHSQIAVSERGFGWDTCRYWEVPFCTAMLANEPGIVLPYPFAHESTCIAYNSPEDAIRKAKYYLDEDPAALEDIRKAGRAHLLKYHTNRERVRTMFDRLGMEP